MKSTIKIFILGILANILLSCSSVYYTDIGIPQISNEENQQLDDKNFGEKLGNLIEKKFPKQTAIKAVSDHFNILLIGEVDSKATQTSLVKYVKKHDEVKKVFDYTTISIKPKLNYNSSLVSDVEDRLAKEYNINAGKVTVSAIGGIVYIMGTNIGDLTSLQKAIAGVAALEGVTKVINLVQSGNIDYYSVDK